jgi:peroxiredoxin/Cu/Ag efflux protein CusF
MDLRSWASLLVILSLIAGTGRHAEARFEGEGRVVALDEAKGTVTLDHGPIPGLMPAMRMAFPVREVKLLRGIKVGEVVRFLLESRGPEWMITTVQQVGGQAAGRPSSAGVSVPAPDFALPTLSGGSLRLADIRGKVVLLNFWATWCVPCRTEMPAIEALSQRYKDQGLQVVGINMDVLSTTSVEAFVKEVGVTFPILLDPSWTTARAYKVVGLPTTYLIDRSGNVVVREVGERNWTDEISEAAVQGLLK